MNSPRVSLYKIQGYDFCLKMAWRKERKTNSFPWVMESKELGFENGKP